MPKFTKIAFRTEDLENSTEVADHRLKSEKTLWSRNELELSAFQIISIRGTISWSQAY